jgi:hypothetical protein
MISWLLRVILLPAGIVWFVGKNQPNFGLAQSVVALFVFISFGEVLAQAPQPAPRPPLDPQIRRNAIAGYNEGCFKKMRAATDNKEFSDNALRQYCACIAEAVADNVTFDELQTLLSGPTAQLEAILKRMEPIIAKAAGPCAEKMP